MTTASLLPVLRRELRTASRRPSSYWSRVIAAGVCLLVSGSVLGVIELSSGIFPSTPGIILFSVLKYMTFIGTCLAGLFLTSDCLSEEKREGTMGLLFLTDLRGYDVVFGKLGATSLRAAYGLLAAFPILALGFLMGGVTGKEFWLLTLVLCNTLFFSLACGMFISAISRDSQKAMWGTVLLLFTLILLPWALDAAWAAWTKSTQFVSLVSVISPFFSLLETGAARTSRFWVCMGITHGLAWFLLGLASFASQRSWQEKVHTDTAHRRSKLPLARVRYSKSREAREQMLTVNPVRWLGCKQHWAASLSRWLVFLGALAFLGLGLAIPDAAAIVGSSVSGFVALVFVLAVASQASNFFIETKRAGFLESILVTPLTVEAVISGHWWAMRRIFLFPAVVLVGMMGVGSALQYAQFHVSMSGVATGANSPNMTGVFVMQIISSASGLLNFLTGLLAVSWFGMWMGLTTSKPHVAVLKTIAFVKLLPWFAFSMLQVSLSIAGFARMELIWLVPVITGVLSFATDITFTVISYRKVHRHLRAWAATELGSATPIVKIPQPPPLPSTPAFPPAREGD